MGLTTSCEAIESEAFEFEAHVAKSSRFLNSCNHAVKPSTSRCVKSEYYTQKAFSLQHNSLDVRTRALPRDPPWLNAGGRGVDIFGVIIPGRVHKVCDISL